MTPTGHLTPDGSQTLSLAEVALLCSCCSLICWFLLGTTWLTADKRIPQQEKYWLLSLNYNWSQKKKKNQQTHANNCSWLTWKMGNKQPLHGQISTSLVCAHHVLFLWFLFVCLLFCCYCWRRCFLQLVLLRCCWTDHSRDQGNPAFVILTLKFYPDSISMLMLFTPTTRP